MSASVLMANIRTSFKHNFSAGEFLIKKSSNGDISHVVVDEVVSDEKIKVRTYMRDGSLSDRANTVQGRELTTFVSNFPANQKSGM